jgi:hypothetical protein
MKSFNIMRIADETIPPPATGEKPIADDDAHTGLPLLHTWRRVYLFVFGCFLLTLGFLIALTLLFS